MRFGLTRRRPGFTLVELIVVVALILTLSALAVMFIPGATTEAREANAAASVQGWLNIARQKAQRDQAPRGLRLWLQQVTDINNATVLACTQAEFVEQPVDFGGGTLSGTANSVTISGVDATNGSSVVTDYSVQPGDYLEVAGSGLMHLISNVHGQTTPSIATTLTLNTALPYTITSTSYYRIVRSPRPLGDEMMQLPNNLIIDLSTNSTYGNTLPGVTATSTSFDIVFAPSGAVITPGLTQSTINLWIHRMPDPSDPTNPIPSAQFLGSPSVVAVFVATGQTGAYPPVPSGSNPYALVQ